ncbi:hypothetical protein ISCGN_026488 [Ixodes scapularis]
MDEDDAEEAAAGSTDKRSPVASALPAAENVVETNTSDASPSAGETEHAGQQEMVATEAPTPSGVESINSYQVNGQPAVYVPMNDADKTAKRTREENVAGPKDSEQEEPPSKAGPIWMRRLLGPQARRRLFALVESTMVTMLEKLEEVKRAFCGDDPTTFLNIEDHLRSQLARSSLITTDKRTPDERVPGPKIFFGSEKQIVSGNQ